MLKLPARQRSRLSAAASAPEGNIAFFGFLLNHPWEFLQVPLFEGMQDAPHWEAILICTQAALGDAVILVAAYAAVSIAARSRQWILAPTWRDVAAFVAFGLAATILLEWINTGPLDRWSYSPAMPVIPILDVGLSPLVQWMLLPPALLWIVRRQLT
jgi:hypothetical protein